MLARSSTGPCPGEGPKQRGEVIRGPERNQGSDWGLEEKEAQVAISWRGGQGGCLGGEGERWAMRGS